MAGQDTDRGADQRQARDRRSCYRVSDRALVELVVLVPDQVPARRRALAEPRLDAFAAGSEFHQMREQVAVLRRHAARESEAFAKLFDGLDRRLDRLTAVLMSHELVPETTEPLDVDVAAEGLGLLWPQPLPDGTMLELRLVFPSTCLGVHSLGRVVHCRGDAGGGYRLGIVLEFTNASDREMLAQHVVQRELALLRERQLADHPD